MSNRRSIEDIERGSERKHTVQGSWNPDRQMYDFLPAAFVVMRTERTRNGLVTMPLSSHPTPESAIARITQLVTAWSTDRSVNPEDCPAFYFHPVEAAP